MELCYKNYQGDKTTYYFEDFVALDTETSHNENETWISSIQVLFQDTYHLFRSPMELVQFYNELIEKYGISTQFRLVTIIHNASYDLSFLIPYLQLYLPGKDDRSGIYDGPHKIKQYRQGGLEFRCTLTLSGQSLEKWGKSLDVEHKKQVGLYDYGKVIYQDTELTEQEQIYDKFDVLSLSECYQRQMEIYGDNVATVPNTSTGYVRREFRQSAQRDRYYRKQYFQDNKLTVRQYKFCVDAFAGGYTHNNRYKMKKIIPGPIGHRDFRSHYPSVSRVNPLPFGKGFTVYKFEPGEPTISLQRILNLYPEYSTITKLAITKASLPRGISMPFMQWSKLHPEHGEKFNVILDNGRVLFFEGLGTMYLDNLTLKILTEQYNMEYVIMEVIAFKNEYMPKCLSSVIDTYFKAKSDYKIEMKRCEKLFGINSMETKEAGLNLMLSKRLLNGIYGMFATSPIQNDCDIDMELENPFITHIPSTDLEKQEKLDKFYSSRNNFLPYQVGVFIPAYARYELYEYIKCIGYENVLYCDTDSIFYKKSDEIEERIAALNQEKNDHARDIGAYITDINGKRIYYDVFESEEDLVAFKGLHSKCYGYITDRDEFCATIAGVPDRKIIGMEDGKPIYITREEELGGVTLQRKLSGDGKYDPYKALENLSHQFCFHHCTGRTCEYDLHLPKVVDVDGHTIHTGGGAFLRELDSKMVKDVNVDILDVSDMETEVDT